MPEGGWRCVGSYLQMCACVFSDIEEQLLLTVPMKRKIVKESEGTIVTQLSDLSC